jgi:hypothetical protein
MARKHEHDLKVFILPKGQPAGPPRPGEVLRVEADSLDGLLPAAERVLAEAGRTRHRAISFTPKGLIAYVEEIG